MNPSATDPALQKLLLSTQENSVQLGLTILSGSANKAAYARIIAVVAHCKAKEPIGQNCRIFLHKNLAQVPATQELDFLACSWPSTVAAKDAYLVALQQFEHQKTLYQTYFDENQTYGQQIYEAIIEQLLQFQQDNHAATYYGGLLRWFSQKANYWYQYAKLSDACNDVDYQNYLIQATDCDDSEPIHYIDLALFYLGLNNKKHALQWIQQAILRYPEHAPVYCLLGDMYAAVQQWTWAAKSYRKALQFDVKELAYQHRWAASMLAQVSIPDSLREDVLAYTAYAYHDQPDHILYGTTHVIALWLCANKKIEALEILQSIAHTALGRLVQLALIQDKPEFLQGYFEQYPAELFDED